MKKTDIYKYYAFGYNYYLLQNECLGITVHKKRDDTDTLQGRIEDFLNFLSELDLRVTEKASKKLLEIKKKISKLPQGTTVDEKLNEEVSSIINNLDTTLDAELQLRTAYILTEKRYDLDNLVSRISKIFAIDVFDSLPDLCKYDFQEAGKAIAFGLPTSAAYHLMRGIEGVLRYYYQCIIKRNRIEKQMWGPIIDHLKKKRNPPPKGLIDTLDNIRINYRNPTQHPDSKYDIDEAQDLLSLTGDAVNRMIKDLNSRGL